MSITVSSRSVFGRTSLRLVLAGIGAALALSACTTIEGTNALTDPFTFEREVLRTTLSGVGVIDKDIKEPVAIERSPLVVPASGTTPPPPSQSVASIPEDSNRVTIDPSGLTSADLEMLRSGRVIGSGTITGRPLTDAETRQLAARIAAYRRAQGGEERSIYLPPEQYFQQVGSQSLICLAANGDLVQVNDPRCPPDVRAALANR